ncbi:hypothetical protein BJ546DRAFT_237123 [Cryomyces antarcticus]
MLELAVESWAWYGVAVTVAIARLVSRTLHFGSPKRLQIDDWLMVFVLCIYTTLVVSINIVADVNTNLLPPGFDVSELTEQDMKQREYGSKMVLVVEQCQCISVWTVKLTLVIMYYRLTIARKENIAVKLLAGYIAIGFIFMEIFYLGVWCRPFRYYWAVPTPIQCSAAINHLITNAVFNLSSDLIMLGIALPMFIRSELPLKKKMILCCIFGLGIFVILSALLNKYYSFTEPFGSMWTFWYVREVSTAILVANLPFTWTLLRRIFNLRSFDGASGRSRSYYSQRTRAQSRQSRSPGGKTATGRRSSKKDVERKKNGDGNECAETESTERIMDQSDLALEPWHEIDSDGRTPGWESPFGQWDFESGLTMERAVLRDDPQLKRPTVIERRDTRSVSVTFSDRIRGGSR